MFTSVLCTCILKPADILDLQDISQARVKVEEAKMQLVCSPTHVTLCSVQCMIHSFTSVQCFKPGSCEVFFFLIFFPVESLFT